MTRTELALAMGVNIRTIGTWEDAGLPICKPGARGRGNAAEYDLAACMAWAAANGRGNQMRTLPARNLGAPVPSLPSVVDLLENACPAAVGALLAEGYGFEPAIVILSSLLAGIAEHLEGAGHLREAQRVMDILPLGTLSATHPFRLAALAFADLFRVDA